MYLLLLVMFPLLLLFNSYLAIAALVAAIVSMYVERTRPTKRSTTRGPESEYKAGYED